MAIKIISDVHANPKALERVLREAPAEKTVFLGDVTGYGYDAARCIQMLREAGVVHLIGNHDEVATTPEELLAYARETGGAAEVDRITRELVALVSGCGDGCCCG